MWYYTIVNKYTRSAYCIDFAIGYLGILNVSLVYSNTGEIEILPVLLNSGFDKGIITGIRARTQATVEKIERDIENGTATVEIKYITFEVNQ